MKVAVVGGGFAGLGLCYYLLHKGCQVDLIEREGIGRGASGVAAGLLHPYVGRDGKRSDRASYGMAEAKQLLAFAQKFSLDPLFDDRGILRKVTLEQYEMFMAHRDTYRDVSCVDATSVWISSGITVAAPLYLQALYRGLQTMGLCTKQQHVQSWDDVMGYDRFFLALGKDILSFPCVQDLRIKGVKGQSLLYRVPPGEKLLEQSVIGSGGHVIPYGEKHVYVGSTYERGMQREGPDVHQAKKLLFPAVRLLGWKDVSLDPVSCQAGVRVSCMGHYFPLYRQVHEKGYIVTGLGSRGLLYHGYVAKLLVQCALQ